MAVLPHIERILDAARIAPSHGNLQPWRFVAEGETVSILVDAERDRSPADGEGRMARIAAGAALECALLRAGRMGATVKVEAPRGNALVTMTISGPRRVPEPDKALVRRTTNRRLFDGRPVDDATFTWLHEATPPLDATRTLWFGRERVRTLGPILEEGEAVYYGESRVREAALRTVRFDVRDREEVAHGLSLGCLELTAPERVTFDALRHTPQERLAAMGAFRRMGARARRLVESASGVCVITTSGSDPTADLAAGRAMQRAWLALTRRGLAAQPMTSIPQLEVLLELDERAGAVSPERDRMAASVAALRAAFPSAEKGSRVAVLLRFGWAPAPSSVVRRLPLEESLREEPT